jgi:hypothetical protein
LAEIVIRRLPGGWRDRFRSYKVYVDGSVVARIRRGQTAHIEVTSGKHELEVGIDWMKSSSIVVDVDEDPRRNALVCGPAGFGMLGIANRQPGTWLFLERGVSGSTMSES